MANTSVVNLNADLMGLGGSHLDVLNGEVLAGLPGDGGLAGDGLFSFALVSVLFFTGCATRWHRYGAPTQWRGNAARRRGRLYLSYGIRHGICGTINGVNCRIGKVLCK